MGIIAASAGEWFPNAVVRTAVLETAYTESERQMASAIDTFRPNLVLSFGVGGRAGGLCLERFARNIDDAEQPDIQGEVRIGKPIVPEGPPALTATLDLAAVYQNLSRAGIPARISDHAGTYVCNHLFYYGLFHLARQNYRTRMGFVHMPPADAWFGSGRHPVPACTREMALVHGARTLVETAARLSPF